MPESTNLPLRSATTSDWVGTKTRLRLGIAPRLGFAFFAVIVLAIVANLIAEHGTSIIETSHQRAEDARRVPGVDGVLKGRGVSGASSPQAEADAFVAALADADRVVRDRVSRNGIEATVAVDRALRSLVEGIATYPLAEGTGDSAQRRELSHLAGTYRGEAAVAIHLADTRRDLFEAYGQRLAAIDMALKGAIDRSWKIFGRVVAREYLIDLSRCLEDIQRQSGPMIASAVGGSRPSTAIVASEARFDALLRSNASSLRRSQGDAWEAELRAGFDDLVAERASVVVASEHLQQALGRLAGDRNDLLSWVRSHALAIGRSPATSQPGTATSIAATTSLSAPESGPTPPRRPAASAREWVAWITALVLVSMLVTTVSTILSIVRPVRRLVEGTRRLSAGGPVQVARGGIRELDVLAVAFNDMARQVAAAHVTAHAHQAQLEATVQERTRALQHLADHDPLTELPNRRLLIVRLTQALAEAAKAGLRVGVYLLDIDNFKNLNDSMGHGFGDRALQGVAERLRESARQVGFAARLGGDEFAIVYLAAPSAAAIAEAGATACRSFQRPLDVNDRQIKISMSIGVSVYPDDEQSADALLRAADAALFRAKALGRSQLRMFTPDLLEAAVAKFTTEQGLRRAVDLGELELVFQPEVSLRSRTPTLVEALLRWRTPAGELLAPGDFLGVAEESGLILDISDWVLRTAIGEAAAWYHGAWPNVRVAINVSPRQLFDTRFVDRVCDLLHHHRLPPSCIELELTENVLQTGPATIDILRQLHANGITIALDDFGTGYSSLSSLELLPLSRVKLDRSLIASVDTSDVSRAIAGAIIDLCGNLDLEVTAEGIERPEQLAMLSGYSRMHVQGYLLSRPVASADLIPVLNGLPSHVRALLAGQLRAQARHSEQEDAPPGRRRSATEASG